MSEKIVLVDGHSILNRAFYGIPDLSNKDGLHTNAIYGFLNILFKILEEEKPQYLAIAFDVKAPTFRHDIYKDYKGTRKPMPEELREQVPVMKEVLKAMDVCIVEHPGLEADDILGTIAKKSEEQGLEVALVSGDRDLLQIASKHIKIRIPKTKFGKTEVEDYYWDDVIEKYQVDPIQFIELKALMGDASDNIPGVPKVGEKTATQLLVEYKTIDGIYENIESITKKAIKESLMQHKDLALLSKVLATIEINGVFDYSLEQSKLQNLYTKEAYVLFKQLEFKNFLNRFEKIDNDLNFEKKEQYNKKFQTVIHKNEIENIFEKCKNADIIGLHIIYEKASKDNVSCEVDSGQMSMDFSQKKDLFSLAIAFNQKDVYWIHSSEEVTVSFLEQSLSDLASSRTKDQVLAAFDIKNAYQFLNNVQEHHLFCTNIAAYLLNPLKNDYKVEDVASQYLGIEFEGRAKVFGKADIQTLFREKKNELMEYMCYCAYSTFLAVPILKKELEHTNMHELFYTIEMPLSYVLFQMEKEGVEVRGEELKEYGTKLLTRIQELEIIIHNEAGEVFNINSPKQLGEILFEKLEIPRGKKTKTGFATGVEILEKLATQYPIAAHVLEYRGLTKLKSTYADGLANYIEEDNRIHTNFNQTITATGRISSTEPNLQNIPMKMELGRQIRKVFVPKKGCIFMDADYSQIELRLLAHMSGDCQLIEAYKQEKDIHKITASKVFHTPFDEVTDLQRRNAKAVNFGIVYGISSFGLSEDLNISRKEAKEYIDQYFNTYPGVKDFLDKTVEDAKNLGYVTTMFGRKRPIPELKSSNFNQRSFGERVAMNSPIQGTAADIMKIAMINVYKKLQKEKLQSKMILQVHDEIVIEVYPQEIEQVRDILTSEMMNAANLSVSLDVELHMGNNWYECK